MNGLELLSNRAMSSYPISIGTSLALESIHLGPNKQYDETRVVPNKVDINNYDCVYINIMTLYRNIVGSIDKDTYARILPGDLVIVLEQEINIIREIINNLSNNKVDVLFYCSKYNNLNKEFPNNLIRVDNTDKQKQYKQIMQIVLNEYLKSNDVKVFESSIHVSKRSKCLIITHQAYDLLAYDKFEKIDLLESHTGILKNKTMFYSKLNNGKDLIRIPFNRITFQIFGDKELITPMPSKIRNIVIELANKYNWTQVTTISRIKYCFEQINELEISNLLKNLK